MNTDDYQSLSARTFKPDSMQDSLLHCLVGILTEAGELGDTIKKHVYYGQALDVENLVEELGDLGFYVNNLATTIGVAMTTINRQNVEKLARRYPSGFTDYHAAARLDKE